MSALVAGLCVAGAALCARRDMRRRRVVRSPPPGLGETRDVVRWRWPGVVSAVVAGVSFVPLPLGAAVGIGGAAVIWTVLTRAERPEARRRRELAARDLPDVVQLLGVALASGTPLSGAVQLVARARPGPAAEALVSAERRLSLGLPWHEGDGLPTDPGLARLGRALTRAMRSGAPVAATVARLAGELAAQRRLEVAERARTVGVKAAIPLGLCLLPAFLLLGIVPVVAASLRNLPW